MSAPKRNETKDLADIASFFEILAGDQLAMNARRYGSKRDQRDREVEARVWREAADILRNTDIKP